MKMRVFSYNRVNGTMAQTQSIVERPHQLAKRGIKIDSLSILLILINIL